jgi:N-acetylneuraminate synthase
MVVKIRETEQALGDARLGTGIADEGSVTFRRSIFVVQDVAAGGAFTRENVRVIRPGQGLPPRELPGVLGRRARMAIQRGTPMSWDLVEGGNG